MPLPPFVHPSGPFHGGSGGASTGVINSPSSSEAMTHPIYRRPPVTPRPTGKQRPFLGGRVKPSKTSVGKAFPAKPSVANLPVCDDFNSYTPGMTLTQANPFYSLWDYEDFVISEDGQLVGNGVNTDYEALFDVTWESPGTFSVSIDIQLEDNTEGGEVLIWLGDLEEWNEVLVVYCSFPSYGCGIDDEVSGQGITHPFSDFTSPFQTTMTLAMEESGLLTMTVAGQSMEYDTGRPVSLPWDLQVSLTSYSYSSFSIWDFAIDNLRYPGCAGTMEPTASPAPTSSHVPTAEPSVTAEPTVTPSLFPTVLPPPTTAPSVTASPSNSAMPSETLQPICDDFNSYTPGMTLTQANPFYSLWYYDDFVISDDGQLVRDGNYSSSEVLFDVTWESPGAFSVSIDLQVEDLTENGDVFIRLGDLEEAGRELVAYCFLPDGGCGIYDDLSGQSMADPFSDFTSSFKTTMTFEMEESGLLTLRVAGQSMEYDTGRRVSLPWDLQVSFSSYSYYMFDFAIDNLRYPGCGGAIEPTASPAPTSSHVPTAEPSVTAEPSDTASMFPTVPPPPVCDDFDSYPDGSSLSEANPIYSVTDWGVDFRVSEGKLVENERNATHVAFLPTASDDEGSFATSIEFDFDVSSDDGDSFFALVWIDPADNFTSFVGAYCYPSYGFCDIYASDESYVEHPFGTSDLPWKGTLALSTSGYGLFVMTINQVSVGLHPEVDLSFATGIYVAIMAEFGTSSSLDRLSYTGCDANTRSPTTSPAPSMSMSPTDETSMSPTVTPSVSPTVTPPSVSPTVTPPSVSPTVTPPLDANTCHGAAVYGDPHFYTFRGEYFSYHGGGTEFILIKNNFIELHARFEIVSDYFSGTTDVAFQVGGEVGEILLDGTFYKGGVVTSLPSTVGGFAVTSPSTGYFEIVLGGCNIISIYGINDVRRRHVEIVGHSSQFDGSLGLLGSWSADGFIGRDGVSLMANETAFGEAWVVDSNQGDPNLFLSRRLGRRQLGIEDIDYPSLTVDLENPDPEAAAACDYIEDPNLYENCLFDVIATEDLTMAESDFYEEPISEVVMEEFCESNCNSNCEDAGGSCMFRCNSDDFLCVEGLCKFIDESKNDGVVDDNDATVEGCSCGLPLGTPVADDAASCGDDGGGEGGGKDECKPLQIVCRICGGQRD